MVNIKEDKKNKYMKLKTSKWLMSQMFDDDAKVLPFTNLKLTNIEDAKLFDGFEVNNVIYLSGLSKGKGFAGTVKKWGFRGGPRSHGQIKHRSPGSIGTQGQSRVIPGRKMPGRMGGDRITIATKFLGLDQDNGIIKVKGGVPGGRNSEVFIYLPVKKENEN